MLTRRLTGAHISIGSREPLKGVFMGFATFLIVLAAVWKGLTWSAPAQPVEANTAALGAAFLSPQLESGQPGLILPLEVLSLLLLIAMIGAIVIARRDGPRAAIPTLKRRRRPREVSS